MNENLSREEQIFHAASDLPPASRAAFVAQACGDDAALAARVNRLLEAAASFMAVPGVTPPPAGSEEEQPGCRMGRYRIIQKIGEGGCGVVYLAEQEEPIRRRVAVKVIKRGMDTREVIARFESERQALALMQHPNIAQVFDAGETPSGRPYFVMELIRGQRITRYCDENQLTPGERLKLFAAVCGAVQHAHEKGVIHRDLKPSNILVTVEHGEPIPKVIDFGIAKATGGKLTDHTVYTAFEQFIGTPAYMSPEQAQYTMEEVDARSDVYSLGVLLYELLTGQPPFNPKDLAQAGLDEMRRVIREVEPAKPSSRLRTLTPDSLNTTATQRGTVAARLVKLVHGDLDWIVLKTIEKDRRRRYASAAALAEDVGRFLEDRPVSAHRPSRLYRARKHLRRHRRVLTIAALTLAVGVLATAVYFRGTAKPADFAAGEVGVMGDIDAMVFRGNAAFSAKVLRDALAGDQAFFVAAHSHALLAGLLETTRARLTEGYHDQGFSEARVETGVNRSQQRIEVTIHEGARLDRGDVIVTGNHALSTAQILEALTTTAPPDPLDEAIRGLDGFDGRPASPNPGAGALFGHYSTITVPAWIAAPGAGLRASDRENVIEAVLRRYEQRGYPFAEVTVDLVPQPATHRVNLRIEVREGPPARVGEVRVHGATRNRPEAVSRCAGLLPGMPLDAGVLRRARVNLWSSARLYGFSLEVRRARDPASGACDIDLTVAESEAMPLLDAPLSRQNSALVRFANWVTAEASRRPLSISLRSDQLPEIRFALTTTGETAGYVGSPEDSFLFAVLAGPKGVRFFGADQAGATGFDFTRFHAATEAFIYLFTDWPDGKSTRHANLSMGYGFVPPNSIGRRRPRLIVSPSLACQYLVPEPVAVFADGVVTIDHTIGGVPMYLQFREDSGELLELRSVPMTNPQAPEADPVRFSVRLGAPDYAEVMRRVEEGWARMPYDPSMRRPVADLLLNSPFGRQLTASATHRRAFHDWVAAIRLAQRLLASPDARLGLDDNSFHDSPRFEISPAPGSPPEDIKIAGSQLLYGVSRILRPVQSWPSRLAREGAYVLRGETGHTAAVLEDLHADPDMGPIGSLVVAETLAAGDPKARARFIARAASLESVRGFETDYYNLVQRDDSIGRLIRFALPGVASLTDPEVDAIAATMSPADAHFVRALTALLKTTKLEDAPVALQPLFNEWCESRISAAAAGGAPSSTPGAAGKRPTR